LGRAPASVPAVPAPPVPAVLQIRNIAKRFGQTEAIGGVDLSVD
jgi:ABC-type sugar transport system ATPase subunit